MATQFHCTIANEAIDVSQGTVREAQHHVDHERERLPRYDQRQAQRSDGFYDRKVEDRWRYGTRPQTPELVQASVAVVPQPQPYNK